MSQETTIKIEPIEYIQVKQEYDDCPQEEQEFNDYAICPEICLQEFLKTEIKEEEEPKQDMINEQDAAGTGTNDTSVGLSHFLIPDTTNNPKQLHKYECKVCNKIFKTTQKLRRHEIVHIKVQPYRCETCYKSFKEEDSLKVHERTHTGERPYECTMCNEAFTTKQKLNRHEMIHTAESVHINVRYAIKFQIQLFIHRHEIFHAGLRPY
ncbi:zinc finger protein 11-like [Ctenocephalides felis]|uniref:zinc finger protein 11-like n=1 Tax=Ctenocephalides felis TaxID=7515 RepID=UPI000E6E482A|nr:zinc finger protein 11-like [Ctenocephalides felis]